MLKEETMRTVVHKNECSGFEQNFEDSNLVMVNVTFKCSLFYHIYGNLLAKTLVFFHCQIGREEEGLIKLAAKYLMHM